MTDLVGEVAIRARRSFGEADRAWVAGLVDDALVEARQIAGLADDAELPEIVRVIAVRAVARHVLAPAPVAAAGLPNAGGYYTAPSPPTPGGGATFTRGERLDLRRAGGAGVVAVPVDTGVCGYTGTVSDAYGAVVGDDDAS